MMVKYINVKKAAFYMVATEEDVNAIRSIVESMFNKKQFGGKHTQEVNLLRHVKWCKKNTIKNTKEFLKKSDWFYRKPSTGEVHYSLEPSQASVIEDFLTCPIERAIEILNQVL